MCVTVWAKKADWPIEYITATQHRSSGKKSKKETEKNWIQHSMVTGHQRVLYVYLVWKRAMNQCCTCVCEFNDMQGNGPAWLQQQEQQRTKGNNATSIDSRATDQRSYNWIVQSVQKVCVCLSIAAQWNRRYRLTKKCQGFHFQIKSKRNLFNYFHRFNYWNQTNV